MGPSYNYYFFMHLRNTPILSPYLSWTFHDIYAFIKPFIGKKSIFMLLLKPTYGMFRIFYDFVFEPKCHLRFTLQPSRHVLKYYS